MSHTCKDMKDSGAKDYLNCGGPTDHSCDILAKNSAGFALVQNVCMRLN